MITAKQALDMVAKPIEIDRMLIIADQKVKEAISNGQTSCVILFRKEFYSDAHLREFSIKVRSLGYLYFPEMNGNSESRSNAVELRW